MSSIVINNKISKYNKILSIEGDKSYLLDGLY